MKGLNSNIGNSLLIRAGQYGLHSNQQDSLQVASQVDKMLDYEYHRGSANGTGLSNYGNPNLGSNPSKKEARDWVMNKYFNDLPKGSPVELGEQIDFRYNTGKDARIYGYQEYLRKQKGNPNYLWEDRKTYGNYVKNGVWTDKQKRSEFDKIYEPVQNMNENERRILLNKGRDWYYQNINKVNGKYNPAYEKTWYNRIWNMNSYKPYQDDNDKFWENIH